MPVYTCRSGLLWRLQALLVLALACASGAARAEDYSLAPGDVVRLEVAGIEQFSTIAAVSNDGFVSLPYFGRVKAHGRTVEEVRTTLQDMVGSIAFRVFDASRLATVLDVAPSDVVLEVERYRDISVSGFVATPGLVPFSPGMTVRSAVAAAGGILRQDAAEGGIDLAGMAMRLAEIGRLSRARADTLANIWRLESELGENPPAPTAAELGLDPDDAEELLALHAEMLEIANESHGGSLELLDSLNLLFEKRTQYLEEQQKYQAEALESDRQELARIRALEQRGLVLADRVHDMNRTRYLSEAQFLQTQAEIERLRIQHAQSNRERQELDSDRREEDLAALAKARLELSELDSQISGAQSALALSAPGTSPEAMSFSMATEAVIHRGTGAEVIELRPGLDALVRPGDAIEIVFTETTGPESEASRPAFETGATQ